MTACLAIQIGKNDLQIAGKLPQNLPARTAWWGGCFRRGDDNHASELAVSFRERLEDGDALGADGQAIRGVFDVAASDDRSIYGFERSADFETGIVSMGVLANRARGSDEVVDPPGCVFRIPDPGSRIPS